jgi:Predicted nucleoside-diphosphate-sugar epimerase
MRKLPLFFLYGNRKVFSPNSPRIIIASGKASVGISIILKKYNKDKVIVIQIQDPRVNSKYFDIVSSPIHDKTLGNNVIKTYGALNRINSKSISDAKIKFKKNFTNLKKPIIPLLIGGNNKHFKIQIQEINNLSYNRLINSKKS